MWAEKNISLVEFYRTALEAARDSGYLYIACVVARYAEYEKGFDYLQKHWSSFHDLTGKEILLIIAGENVRNQLPSENLVKLDRFHDDGASLVNSDISISGNLKWLENNERYRNILPIGSPKESLCKDSHATQTTELMSFFNINENHGPAFCLTSIATGITSIYKIEDKDEKNLYNIIKYIKGQLQPILSSSVKIESNLKISIENMQQIEKELKKYKINDRNELNKNLIQWRKENFGDSNQLDNFVNTFIELKAGELPLLSIEEARRTLKSCVRKSNLYQSGRKRIDKYFSIVEMENSQEISRLNIEKEKVENDIKENENILYKNEKTLSIEIAKYLGNKNIVQISDAFDSKINLGIAKVDIKILFDRLKKFINNYK